MYSYGWSPPVPHFVYTYEIGRGPWMPLAIVQAQNEDVALMICREQLKDGYLMKAG
jgi:hypothetical protein